MFLPVYVDETDRRQSRIGCVVIRMDWRGEPETMRIEAPPAGWACVVKDGSVMR